MKGCAGDSRLCLLDEQLHGPSGGRPLLRNLAMEMFGDRLATAVRQKKTPAMVGIDPRPDLLPREFVERFRLNPDAANTTWAEAVAEFCSRVIDVVSPYVPVVKFQIAFFELYRAPGITVLESLLSKARQLG